MAIKKRKQGSKKDKEGNNTQVECYYFDVEKCKHCPFKNEYDKINACEKLGITIQGATTLFLANMKRIIKLNEEKNKNIEG